MKEVIEILKKEEIKYRNQKNNTFHGLYADIFKIAYEKFERDGMEKTYNFFKNGQNKYSEKKNNLSSNLAHSYGLVVGKLWKYYVKFKVEQKRNI